MPQYPAVINLSSLNGSNGFKISGPAAYQYMGISVSSAGDVNGDGFADIIVSAPGNKASPGAAYVIFGKASGFAANIDPSSLNGSNGFALSGVPDIGFYGYGNLSVATAGDINGDGFADLLVGSDYAGTSEAGATYVLYGKAGGFAASIDLGSNYGAKLSGGAAYAYTSFSISSAGDINGDGFADVIIGSVSQFYSVGSAEAYVVFGGPQGLPTNLNLSSLDGSNGFKIYGETFGEHAGRSVANAGDVNGDGIDDLIIGAPFDTPHGNASGAAYVVFGNASGFPSNFDLSSLDGSNGFKISGQATNAVTGLSVSSAGDINGDGLADLVIGAPYSGLKPGAAYVVFGNASGFPANLDLSSLGGGNGFKITGLAPGDWTGLSVSDAGDVNGDGFDDLTISAPDANTVSGVSYVVFGKASGFSNLDLSTLDGTNGFELVGSAFEHSGRSVSAAGDVNNDGFADLIIGAPFSAANGTRSGAAYVVFGRKPDGPVNRVGTNASQILAGGDFDDVLSGGGGNDTLYGNGGNDTLDGGDGIDTAVFPGLRSAYTITTSSGIITVSGPDGTDTLANIEKMKFDDQIVLATQGPAVRNDFNADGFADILWQNDNGQAAIWLMNGLSQNFGSAVGGNPGTSWHVKGASDFDGDGKADVLWQNNDGTPVIWFMNGTTVLSGGVAGFNPGTAWHVIGTGDFNGDGKADILWQDSDGTPAIWLMNGTTLLSGAALSNPGTAWHVIGAGDFSGDGKSDILWQNDNGQAAIWLMDGVSQISGGAVGGNPGTTWHVKGAGDFNGDGSADILWQNDNGQPAIWLMNGLSQISGGAVGGNPGTTWHVKGAGDFNGDGLADILWQNDNGQPAVWTMNGYAQLGGSPVGGNPGSPWHVIAMAS